MTFEQLIPLIIMAFALGMDAFSVSLGMGNDGLKDKTNPVYWYDDRDISYYHAIYWDGIRSFLSEQYGDIAHFAGAILLID